MTVLGLSQADSIVQIHKKIYTTLPIACFPQRSVSAFRSCLIFRVEVLTSLVERYSGARRFSDLYMIVAVSLLMISFIVGHFRL